MPQRLPPSCPQRSPFTATRRTQLHPRRGAAFRGYCWTRSCGTRCPAWEPACGPGRLFEHKRCPLPLLAFAAIMYVPALGWEFLDASTRLTSELNFLLQEIDNCYHRRPRAAPKIEKQIQSKGPASRSACGRRSSRTRRQKSPRQNPVRGALSAAASSNFLGLLSLWRGTCSSCCSVCAHLLAPAPATPRRSRTSSPARWARLRGGPGCQLQAVSLCSRSASWPAWTSCSSAP